MITDTRADPVARLTFAQLHARLPGLLARPRASEPLTANIPNIAGVYLFSEGPTPLYVGQTRKLRQRMRNHRGATSTHNQASFAFLLACTEVEKLHPHIDLTATRAELAADLDFARLFTHARAREAAMDLRFVAIDEPELRTVFEVYAAMELGTPYNTFDTH